jgi:hypothetical protein
MNNICILPIKKIKEFFNLVKVLLAEEIPKKEIPNIETRIKINSDKIIIILLLRS